VAPKRRSSTLVHAVPECRKSIPQGLKPASLLALVGTTEAVPFPIRASPFMR
jgi:hypothetical protein